MTPPTWTAEKAEALKRTIELCSYPTFPIDCEIIRDALAEIDRLTAQVREAETMKVDIEAMRVNLHATFNGGHQFEEARRAFHHGMDTVCNVLAAHQKREQTNGILPPPPAREGSKG